MVESDPRAYDRFYNVIANPILWFIQHYLWDLSNAPDIRQEELDAWDEGYQQVNSDIAAAVVKQIEGTDEPLVMLHDYHLYTAPGMIREAAARRLPAPLRPHPLVPAGQLAGAAAADPRSDLRGDAGQRHHRLPHPRSTASTSCAAATNCWTARTSTTSNAEVDLQRPHDAGARLPAGDRRRAAAAGGGLRRRWRRPSARCWSGGGAT